MADDGASNKELVLEASRRNNTDLLNEVIGNINSQHGKKGVEVVAEVLNSARDPVGYGVLHLAAMNGNYEALDLLLDQEGLEIDELDRMEKDTPLHKAVRFVNGLDTKEWDQGKHIVDILLDAGCDARYPSPPFCSFSYMD